MREYRSGTRWCLMRWKTIADDDGDPYLMRLHVFQCPLFAIMVHWIYREDRAPDEHDHPVGFLSVILRGGYIERRRGYYYVRRRLNLIRARDRHRIVALIRSAPPVVTLCVAGPRRQEWGFFTTEGKVPWREYGRSN